MRAPETSFHVALLGLASLAAMLTGSTRICEAQASQPFYQYTVPAAGTNQTGYDAVGNIVSYTDTVNGTWALNYDQLNRLTAASSQNEGVFPNVALTEQYDSFGNRLSQQSSDSTHSFTAFYDSSGSVTCPNSGSNRLCWIGGFQPSYDSAGNPTSTSAAESMVYDGEGRLCAIGVTGSFHQYRYDAEGVRVAKIEIGDGISSPACGTATPPQGSGMTKYLVGPSGEQITELSGGTNQWVHTNVFAGSKILATYDPTGVHFPITDPLGSVRMQVSGTGSIDQQCGNLPFGEQSASCGTNITELQFTGKERDTESGLDYFGARYYGSTIGRFTSPDSAADEVLSVPIPFADLKNPQSLNLYSYVGNNPLSRTDPDGHDYTICATGQQCVHLTDQQYYDAIHGQGNNGINAPAFGQSGNITCGGAVCGTASYMDQGAVVDLSGGQLMGVAGGKAFGAAFGLIGEAVGRLFGSTATEAAGEGAKVLLQAGTKQAAKDVLDGLADSAQKATLKRSIARATTKEAVSIKQLADGSFEVVKTRPGFDGSQSFTTTIGKDGSSVTVQTAVDSTGAQVHYDPK